MRGPHPCLWLSPGLQGSEARRLFPQPPAQPLLKGKNTESCRLALSSLTEERPAAGLTEWVLMKPDSPAEKTAPLPRGLYFSMTSLEGAVNPPRSFHRITPHRGRAEGTRTGSLPATPAWKGPQVLQGPPGPRAGQLQMLLQCGSLSHHDVPEEKRSHLHFFFKLVISEILEFQSQKEVPKLEPSSAHTAHAETSKTQPVDTKIIQINQ